MTTSAAWQAEFVERVGSSSDATGLPPSYLQVFAWLVVCDPPHQSVDDIRAALGLSSGAISMATATLARAGLVERVAQPGQRRKFYRFRAGGWERMLRLRIDAAAHLRRIAEQALAQAPEPEPPVRLAEMREIYMWFETNMSHLLAESPWTHAG